MNGDTSINTIDVIAIQRFFLGQSTGIANVGKSKFAPREPHSIPGLLLTRPPQNYDTLVFGDVAMPSSQNLWMAPVQLRRGDGASAVGS